jgi:putative nucleotidyltransferase with HDIG domain
MISAENANITIGDLFNSDLQLTSPPNLFFELNKVLDDPSKSLEDAGNIITKDPGLSVKLLKQVNSPLYGFSGKIATVTHAITILGANEVRNLVLATLIIDKFSAQTEGMMSMHDFWAMSLRNAFMAKELASHCQIKVNKETIFICGLLHEIGKLVFYRRIPNVAKEIGQVVEQTGKNELDVEHKILGFTHYDAGAELTRLWKLPAVISETIAQHCRPDKSSPYFVIADLIRTANLISKMDLSDEATNLNDKWGITDNELSEIIDKVEDQFEEIFSVFYRVS